MQARTRVRLASAAIYALTTVCVLLLISPFLWLLLTSFKLPVDQLTSPPVVLPPVWTFTNYLAAFSQPGIWHDFGNSMVAAGGSTLISLVFGAAAAYGLMRTGMPFALRNLLLVAILFTRMYPGIVIALPYFFIMRDLGLLDTRLALIITYTSFNLPLVVWFLLGFFEGIPWAMEESARIDGASVWVRFWRISVPMVLPGMVASAIFAYVLGWNEFLFAVILTNVNATTVPVALSGFITDHGLDWGPMSALGTAFDIPVLILALLVQRYMIQGLTLGSVKD